MVSWYYLVSWYFSWYSIVRHFYGIVATLAWTIGTDHVIIAERIFSLWVAYNLSAQITGGFPSLYEWERAPPVRPVLCEQN